MSRTILIDGVQRPTWDVVYQGQPLSDTAYRVHLALLRGYRDGKSPQLPEGVHEDDRAVDQAKIAIHSDGRILKDISGASGVLSPSSPFRWCEWRLTEYGEQYLRERENWERENPPKKGVR